MVEKNDTPGLLGTLQKLYSKLSLTILRHRMDSYHKEAGVGSVPNRDISSSLADQIDKLASSEQAKCKGVACEDAARIVPTDAASAAAAQANQSQQQPLEDKDLLVATVLDGLARHFKNGQSESAFQPHVSEKLRKSTLDHIHTAFRLARQGEATNAKLHADIANQALKEVAHYMSADEYKLFAAEVELLLNQIKG